MNNYKIAALLGAGFLAGVLIMVLTKKPALVYEAYFGFFNPDSCFGVSADECFAKSKLSMPFKTKGQCVRWGEALQAQGGAGSNYFCARNCAVENGQMNCDTGTDGNQLIGTSKPVSGDGRF